MFATTVIKYHTLDARKMDADDHAADITFIDKSGCEHTIHVHELKLLIALKAQMNVYSTSGKTNDVLLNTLKVFMENEGLDKDLIDRAITRICNAFL